LLSTEKYQFVEQLPDFADVRTNSYGLVMTFENLNYLYNPVKGWDIAIEIGVGDKLIKKNVSLNPVLYKGLELRSLQFNVSGYVNRFIKVKKRSTVMVGVLGGVINGKNIFENELYRLGGQRTLKGFDDESIFASSFAIGTLEYRFILEENSNLFVFTQGAYYDKNLINSHLYDMPYSFGLGINFQTKPGIFSVSYSLGSQLGNPVLLRSAKIHFGFVNYF
jgi:hemolysin activation/secretion protein